MVRFRSSLLSPQLGARRVLRGLTALTALGVLGLGVLGVARPAAAAMLTGEAAPAFTMTPVVEGIGQATDVAVLPDGRVLITQRAGDILTVLPDQQEVMEHIDVMSGHPEQGLLGVVADPNFATNQYIYFYVSAAADANNRHQVQRYKLDAESKLTDLTVIVSMGLKGPANHNGGGLDFYNGALYLSVGDTGDNNTPPTNKFGTCLNVANGKILRVDPGTGMPIADNPLMALTTVTGCESVRESFEQLPPDKRIYAWGFRNPFRFSVDKQTGKLWVGDVGEGAREEIAVGSGGDHFGWPFFEGTVEYNQEWKGDGCMGVTPPTTCVPAAYEYPQSGGRNAVIGGLILDGCEWPEAWKSRYIFGDHGSGEVWTLDVNANRDGVVADSLKPFASTAGVVSFKLGPDNALYIVEDGGGGNVQRVTANGAPTTTASCPAPGGGGGGGGAGGGGGSAGNVGGTGGSASAGQAAGGTSSSGGSSAAAGSSATAGSGGSGGAPPAEDDGCGCRAVGGTSTSPWAVVSLIAAFGLLAQRRRSATLR